MLSTMLILLSSVALMGLLRQFSRNRARLQQADPYGQSPHDVPMSARSATKKTRPKVRSKGQKPLRGTQPFHKKKFIHDSVTKHP